MSGELTICKPRGIDTPLISDGVLDTEVVVEGKDTVGSAQGVGNHGIVGAAPLQAQSNDNHGNVGATPLRAQGNGIGPGRRDYITMVAVWMLVTVLLGLLVRVVPLRDRLVSAATGWQQERDCRVLVL